MLQNKATRLKRPVYPMPGPVREVLVRRGLMEAYRRRPPYQQNDYLGWIRRARLPETREKRLFQMLDELAAGNAYMGMKYHARSTKSLAEYLRPETIKALATPANVRLGAEIVKDGGVEFAEMSPALVVARVQPRGGVRRTVELRSADQGLAWKCTCTRRKLFCKHCVAAAIASRHHIPDEQ